VSERTRVARSNGSAARSGTRGGSLCAFEPQHVHFARLLLHSQHSRTPYCANLVFLGGQDGKICYWQNNGNWELKARRWPLAQDAVDWKGKLEAGSWQLVAGSWHLRS
jgi:hypothetical protein